MYQRILVPIDGAAPSMLGLHQAMEIARLMSSTVILVNVVDESAYTAAWNPSVQSRQAWKDIANARSVLMLEQAGQAALEEGVSLETRLLDIDRGSVPDLILQEADVCHADLIVMGTHGRRGLNRLVVGSTAEQVVRRARQPVLLVRADEPHKAAALSKKTLRVSAG